MKKMIGCLEQVSIPSLGVTDVLAKVDTGAYSGAIHCSDIRVVRRGEDRQRVLKFTPLAKKALSTETTEFMETYVRSATGHRVKRYIIDTVLVMKGTSYPIRIGLSNRGDMKRAILIGRRFLRENNLLVDVSINQDLDDEGESTK